jgi:hypothetical protein
VKQFPFVVIALALGIPASTPARQQTAAPDDGKREFIVSGCLLRNGYAGYAVEDSRVRRSRPPRNRRNAVPHLDVKSLKTVASGCA